MLSHSVLPAGRKPRITRRTVVAGVAAAIPLALLTGCPAPGHWVCHTGRGNVDPCVWVK